MKPFRACMVLTIAVLANSAGAEEIYKSVDAQGHVVYSDRGATSTARKTVIDVAQPNPTEAARQATEQQILQAEDQQRRQQQAAQDTRKAQAEHDKRLQCEQARTRYNSMKDANLLYRLDKEGNRVFYTDDQADSRKEALRQAMLSACGK